MLKFQLLLILLIILYISLVSCNDETSELSLDDIKKMKVKELRRFLYDRGLNCKGCSEKEEFVNKVFENRNIPMKESEKKQEQEKIDPEEEARKDKEIADLMAKLKSQGFGGNVFSAKDLKNMDFDKMRRGEPHFAGKVPLTEDIKRASKKKIDDDEKIEL